MWVVLLKGVVLNSDISFSDSREADPVVVALVEILKVDVVGVGVFIFKFGGIIIYNNIKNGKYKKFDYKFLRKD